MGVLIIMSNWPNDALYWSRGWLIFSEFELRLQLPFHGFFPRNLDLGHIRVVSNAPLDPMPYVCLCYALHSRKCDWELRDKWSGLKKVPWVYLSWLYNVVAYTSLVLKHFKVCCHAGALRMRLPSLILLSAIHMIVAKVARNIAILQFENSEHPSVVPTGSKRGLYHSIAPCS